MLALVAFLILGVVVIGLPAALAGGLVYGLCAIIRRMVRH